MRTYRIIRRCPRGGFWVVWEPKGVYLSQAVKCRNCTGGAKSPGQLPLCSWTRRRHFADLTMNIISVQLAFEKLVEEQDNDNVIQAVCSVPGSPYLRDGEKAVAGEAMMNF